jgi:5-methylcytosine-specific restriction endonuclease McrA
MPIKPENAARYPKEWSEIRARILKRARNKCEKCGVPNHELGGRTREGLWLPALPLGEKMLRLEWPKPGTHHFCGHLVGEIDGKRRYVGDKLRIIKIVLTIAHLDHTPENCADENLLALCQRCHLAYDQLHHKQTAYATRRKGKAIRDLLETP